MAETTEKTGEKKLSVSTGKTLSLSDAIALAIRAKAPVLVEDRVFDKSEVLPAPEAPRI